MRRLVHTSHRLTVSQSHISFLHPRSLAQQHVDLRARVPVRRHPHHIGGGQRRRPERPTQLYVSVLTIPPEFSQQVLPSCCPQLPSCAPRHNINHVASCPAIDVLCLHNYDISDFERQMNTTANAAQRHGKRFILQEFGGTGTSESSKASYVDSWMTSANSLAAPWMVRQRSFHPAHVYALCTWVTSSLSISCLLLDLRPDFFEYGVRRSGTSTGSMSRAMTASSPVIPHTKVTRPITLFLTATFLHRPRRSRSAPRCSAGPSSTCPRGAKPSTSRQPKKHAWTPLSILPKAWAGFEMTPLSEQL